MPFVVQYARGFVPASSTSVEALPSCFLSSTWCICLGLSCWAVHALVAKAEVARIRMRTKDRVPRIGKVESSSVPIAKDVIKIIYVRDVDACVFEGDRCCFRCRLSSDELALVQLHLAMLRPCCLVSFLCVIRQYLLARV